MLTAHHLIETAEICQMNDEQGTMVGRPGMMVQPVAGRDLVVLDGITWTEAGATLPEFEVMKGYTPSLGELVVLASYPGALSRDRQITLGHVTDTDVTASLPERYRGYWAGAWACDAAATSGSSGGPVFDAKGELAGIVVGQPMDDALKLKFVVPVLMPRAAVTRLSIRGRAARP